MPSKTPRRSPTRPFQLVDPTTNIVYVLVRADVYERLAGTEDLAPRDAYPFVASVMRGDDANDPLLKSYQNIPSRKRR